VVYPTLEAHHGDLEAVFYEELNFLWQVMPSVSGMLTFARYDAQLLPEKLERGLDLHTLSADSLLLLWNVATLTYVMQTSRWVGALSKRFGHQLALDLEKAVWVDRGGAEEDLRYGLIAAGKEKGNVETLLRGFQMAPGEVGLVGELRAVSHPLPRLKEAARHGFRRAIVPPGLDKDAVPGIRLVTARTVAEALDDALG